MCEVSDVVPAVNHSQGYRNKCDFTCGYNDDNELVVGFRGSSFKEKPNYVLDLDGNFGEKMLRFIVPEQMKIIINKFRDYVRQFPEYQAWNERTFSGCWKSVLVRHSEKLNHTVVVIDMVGDL